MKIAVYPGSFDPVTKGHLYVMERSAKMFDHVIVAVLVNVKKTPFFSVEERMQFIRQSVAHLENVSVDFFSGLLVHYLQEKKAQFIIRGLRFVSDLETELQMASMNKDLLPEAETIFIPTHHEYSYISSSIVKEVARLGGDIQRFVPEQVFHAFTARYQGDHGWQK
nr:pantetheine-phosphate adenylyltransferase [Bacilli bacterium]